jgi:hypothetical protein
MPPSSCRRSSCRGHHAAVIAPPEPVTAREASGGCVTAPRCCSRSRRPPTTDHHCCMKPSYLATHAPTDFLLNPDARETRGAEMPRSVAQLRRPPGETGSQVSRNTATLLVGGSSSRPAAAPRVAHRSHARRSSARRRSEVARAGRKISWPTLRRNRVGLAPRARVFGSSSPSPPSTPSPIWSARAALAGTACATTRRET